MGAIINLTDKATQLTKSYSISLMSVDALTPDRPRRAAAAALTASRSSLRGRARGRDRRRRPRTWHADAAPGPPRGRSRSCRPMTIIDS